MARRKIFDSGIPKTLCDEAVKCAVHELNRTPTSALDKDQTPSKVPMEEIT